jgi:hypothetical protein
MTYQQTIESIFSSLQLKSAANHICKHVIELMHEEADRRKRHLASPMVAQRHPLGFFACKWTLGEGRSLRLHLWSNKFQWGQDPGWEIHDHVFSFSSLLLDGSLRNRVYEIDETPCTRAGYSIYEVVYNGNESSMRLIRAGVGVKVHAETNESSGALYSMAAGVLHSSELVSDHALTVLATLDDDTHPGAPRVLSKHRQELMSFDRSPPSDSQVSYLLTEFGGYLEDTR